MPSIRKDDFDIMKNTFISFDPDFARSELGKERSTMKEGSEPRSISGQKRGQQSGVGSSFKMVCYRGKGKKIDTLPKEFTNLHGLE